MSVPRSGPVEGRGSLWRRPEGLLVLGSALLLTSSALLLAATVLTALGWDAGVLGWVALGADPVGAVLLGWSFLSQAGDLEGRARSRSRAAGWLFVLWASLTIGWRFLVPWLAGTNLESLFSTVMAITEPGPADVALLRAQILVISVLWITSAIVFVIAEIGVLLSVHIVPKDDWMRDLPAKTWLVAASVSLLGTLLLVEWMATALGGNPSGNSLAGLALKLVLAPNLFLSGYAASLRLGADVMKASSAGSEEPTGATLGKGSGGA